ncbi:MAG: GAF domain-containing protein [Ktedonobacterales bacterium]
MTRHNERILVICITNRSGTPSSTEDILMQSTPPRSQPSGSADFTHGGLGGLTVQSGSVPSSDVTTADHNPHSTSVAEIFADALDGAMALVRADGGEIAILDDARQVLVLRARRTRPRLDANTLGAYGAPSRQSQPHQPHLSHPSHPSYPSFPARASHSAPLAAPSSGNLGRMSLPSPLTSAKNVADESDQLSELEGESTQLLPSTLLARTYRRGERLIGLCWQLAEPLTMRGEDCRMLPGGSAPPDPDAPWHLAVPILRPGPLNTTAMPRTTSDVIGVITVYNRDPLWSFSPRDVELLTLHADRIARALRAADLARQNQSQSDLLKVLGAEVTVSEEQNVYQRMRDVVRRNFDAPSFAILLCHPRQDIVLFVLAERDGTPVSLGWQPAASLPPWWNVVRAGISVRVSTPEEHALHAEYCMLGWGGDQPVQSILAAPLTFHNSLLGAIVAGSTRPDVYAPEHETLFTTIASSAAILIQNALLADETRQFLARTREKERQLSLLNNAVLTLNASLDLDTTVEALARQTTHITEVPGCAVFLLDESGDSLVARAAYLGDESLSLPQDAVHVPAAWQGIDKMLENGQFLALDALETEWQDDTPFGRLLAAWNITSCLALPLTHNDKAIGVLLVYAPGQRHLFNSEEIGLLQGVASQAAGAISNAKLYAQLQTAYERQKELDRLKDEFILTVSHEFRTPVTAIEGYVTLISRHGHKLEQAKLDQFANEIHVATSQLMGMINMLHDANSIETAPLVLTPFPVNVREIADQALSTQSPEAKARLHLDIPSELRVMGDDERLTHVFSNLISNAIKYSPSHQPCQITAHIETRQNLAQQGHSHAQAEDAPERWVVVGVRDFGEGITPEDQARLFQKFVRLSRSLTTSVRGTGLGLWICRQYIEAMGGDIWVESEFGSGSHFQFSLPATTPSLDAQL